MLVGEAVIDLFELLGNPTDLYPGTAAEEGQVDDVILELEDLDEESRGYQRLVSWLNRGVQTVSMFKLRGGTHVRFRGQEAMKYVVVEPTGLVLDGVEQDVDGKTNSLYVDTAGIVDPQSVLLEGNFVGVGEGRGQIRVIIDVVEDDGGPWLVLLDQGVDLSGEDTPLESVTVYPRYVGYPDGAYSVTRILDVDHKQYVVPASRDVQFVNDFGVIAWPRSYRREGQWLEFESAFPKRVVLRVDYLKHFERFSDPEGQMPLPDPWNDGVLMWCHYRGLMWLREFPDAYAARQNFRDHMESMRQEREGEYDKENGFLFMG